MKNLAPNQPQFRSQISAQQAIDAACRRIAPLFDVRDMVAVNPFMGFSEYPFLQAALMIESAFHESILPLDKNAPQSPQTLCVADRVAILDGEAVGNAPLLGLFRFLSNYVDETAPSPASLRGKLYESYLEFARWDRGPRVAGLSGYAKVMAELPNSATETLSHLVSKLEVEGEGLALYLTRVLARVKGYAGYLRAQEFSAGDTLGQMPELLAIVLAQDYALARITKRKFGPTATAGDRGYIQHRAELVGELARREGELAVELEKQLKSSDARRPGRVLAQLVFCIDVRSESFRRRLERWGDLETYGFAGFFGLPMEMEVDGQWRAHCPPLLQPSFAIKPPAAQVAAREELKASFARGLKAPVSSLSHVEGWGLTYAGKLVAEALPHAAAPDAPQSLELALHGLSLGNKIEMARGILKNLGLRAPLAPLVVLVGHASHVTNNPQAAGLACGACAGHSGVPSAQVAVKLLNDPEVREGLRSTQNPLPDGVLFVAAEHETVTDSVRLVALDSVPPTHAVFLEELELRLEATSNDRQGSLKDAARKTRDYAEIQPEWGLAGNAFFLVGDRALSREQELFGRAFLHSYDAQRDDDGSVLEMILTAPAIVGSWINLQYYASTVAPEVFGSGRKTLHSLVGQVGVVEGAEGDLAVGLARESLNLGEGQEAVHTPVRLHVVVQADPARIRAIIARHDSLRNLVLGEWIQVSAISEGQSGVRLEPVTPDSVLADPSGTVAAE